ncbi:hypothetical protein BDD12DRAFT_887875 [Trichophaea hybrida]|nr:hypothetical protein BDD12DRAFT_887875 [Trichophaea hybrida]
MKILSCVGVFMQFTTVLYVMFRVIRRKRRVGREAVSKEDSGGVEVGGIGLGGEEANKGDIGGEVVGGTEVDEQVIGKGVVGEEPSKKRKKMGWKYPAIRSAITVFFGVFLISMLEMTIKLNSIDLSAAPISSTGQLIPVLIGPLNFCAVILKAVEKVCKWIKAKGWGRQAVASQEIELV